MKILLPVVVLCAISSVCAAPARFVSEKAPVFIAPRSSRSWTFPAVDAAAGRIVVEFRNRVDFPRTAGWCPGWQIEVNGKVLTAAATRSESRLLNRPYALTHKWYGRYEADNSSDKWYALYQPDVHASDRLFNPATGEADRFLIDISDAVDDKGPNTLRLLACGISREFYESSKVTGHKPGMVFHGVEVRQESVGTRLPRREVKEVRASLKVPARMRWRSGSSPEGIAVEMRGEKFTVKSTFSLPGGGWSEMRGGSVLETPFYTVRRTVSNALTRISVRDTFVSKTNALIGVRIRHELPQRLFDPVYVAGDPSPCAVEFADGRHPSVFGVRRGKNCSVALLAEDDVFRVQNVQYCKDGVMGIRTDGFALPAFAERTAEWSIYPVGSEDYFDFVNAVRRDWDVNFPIIGCFNLSMNCYGTGTKESTDRDSRDMGLGVNTFGCHFWSHIGKEYRNYRDNIWGMGKNSPKVRVRITKDESILADPEIMNRFERECIARCREWTPYVKVFTYLHNQISVDAGDDKYEADRLVGSKGNPMHYNGGATQKLFVPTENNLYGRDFMKLTDWYLDTFDLDGIYLDEINYCNSRLQYSDKMWDGATVELDGANNVKRKVSYVSLLKLDFTLGLFDHIINRRGKLMIGNFSPETRSERRFKFPRFEETYNHRWVALSHLYTPIQLGDMLTYRNTPRDMAADQRMALMRGALYYHYLGTTGCPTLTSKMFPFTPVELHGGWLVGEERILTAVSGEFGWRGRRHLAEVFVFDELGREVAGYPSETAISKTGTVVRLELKRDHCAAIVKIPVDAEISGDVRLGDISWKNGRLTCSVEGDGTVVFSAAGGGASEKIRVKGRSCAVFAP